MYHLVRSTSTNKTKKTVFFFYLCYELLYLFSWLLH